MKSGETQHKPHLREAVGVFMDAGRLEKAIEELLACGFDRNSLGMLANEHAVESKLSKLYTRINQPRGATNDVEAAFVENESDEDTVHGLKGGLYFAGGTVAVGAMVASAAVLDGPLVVAITAAAAVGAVGVLTGSIISKSEADFLREQVDQGHVLLFVRLTDSISQEQAVAILTRHAALEVQVHNLSLGTDSASDLGSGV